MTQYKKRILIDLDGVLNNYKKYSDEIPEIKDGTREFLKELSKDYELVLFTSRNLLLASKWLIRNKLDGYFKDITNFKLPAELQVDDRAVCFKGDFKKTLEEIKGFKVYWKS